MTQSVNSCAKGTIHDTESQFIVGEKMGKNLLIELSKQFAIDIINLCNEKKDCKKGNSLFNQILRSGTSIGANIHEGNYGSSRADFINKFQIALKECYETIYWLEIFKETNLISVDDFDVLYKKCCKIRTLLISSLKTLKKNS